jgi:hypothetical protein
MRWLWLGLGILTLCVACAEDDGRSEPLRAPDAGRRFVEQEEAAGDGAAQERAERPPAEDADVDAAEAEPTSAPGGGASGPPPAGRTAAAEDEPPPPPADIH